MNLFRLFDGSEFFHSNAQANPFCFVLCFCRKLLPVNRLAMCRFLMSSVADDPGANLLASHLQAALKHLGLHGGTSVVRVFQAVGEKWSKIRSMKHALKWHEMRQSEISEQYGRAWLEHGGTHFTSMRRSNAMSRKW